MAQVDSSYRWDINQVCILLGPALLILNPLEYIKEEGKGTKTRKKGKKRDINEQGINIYLASRGSREKYRSWGGKKEVDVIAG
jgi:hypothetical protein